MGADPLGPLTHRVLAHADHLVGVNSSSVSREGVGFVLFISLEIDAELLKAKIMGRAESGQRPVCPFCQGSASCCCSEQDQIAVD